MAIIILISQNPKFIFTWYVMNAAMSRENNMMAEYEFSVYLMGLISFMHMRANFVPGIKTF